MFQIYIAKEGGRIWSVWPYNGVSSHILEPYQHLHGFSQSSLRHLINISGYQDYCSFRLLQNDFSHALRILFGEKISRISTTKRYLKLK